MVQGIYFYGNLLNVEMWTEGQRRRPPCEIKRETGEADGCDRSEETSCKSSSAATVCSNFYKFPSNYGISAKKIGFPQPLLSRDLIGEGEEAAEEVTAVEISDDGSWFVSCGAHGTVLLWPTKKLSTTNGL